MMMTTTTTTTVVVVVVVAAIGKLTGGNEYTYIYYTYTQNP
jgi:hypothetical protein